MTQLTVRGFDPELERAVREVARRRGISLSRAAILLMRRGSGLGESGAHSKTVGTSLDHLIGTWSKADEDDLLSAIRSCEQIDHEMW